MEYGLPKIKIYKTRYHTSSKKIPQNVTNLFLLMDMENPFAKSCFEKDLILPHLKILILDGYNFDLTGWKMPKLKKLCYYVGNKPLLSFGNLPQNTIMKELDYIMKTFKIINFKDWHKTSC